jgi:CHC2 zinc finger
MNRRHFDSTESAKLRTKIDKAKQLLPMPSLMRRLGYDEKHIGKTALCPFHGDQHPSFSVFQKNGAWFHRCFVGCSSGDEITFLVKHFGISRREAIKHYLEMAGFPALGPPKSHEYPQCRKSREFPGSHGSHECPKSPEYPVHPMSNGQGLEKELKALAARNACTERNTARKRRWQLARDVRAFEMRLSRELDTTELMLTFGEWHRLSQPFLDSAKTRDDYLVAFLAELGKVRVPTGEGETNKKALEAVSKLPPSELPMIPGMPEAAKSWRRVAALHREMSRLCEGKTYFLSCRDTAKAVPGLSHQTAYNINLVLERLGVIEIVRVGDARPNGKSSRFRYLLAQTENGAISRPRVRAAGNRENHPLQSGSESVLQSGSESQASVLTTGEGEKNTK